MTFTSVAFILFLGALLLVYFVAPKRFQWMVLLAASYLFYLSTSVAMGAYLLLTTLTTYAAARLMGSALERQKARLADKSLEREAKKAIKAATKRQNRWVLTGLLVLNFGLLGYMKYANLFISTAGALLGQRFALLDLAVPLGISFYTFQSMGYAIDVYRAKYPPERSLPRFALFVSFFPQIVQGPIGRYDHLAPQLFEERSFDYHNFKLGLYLLLWGYFKKMVLADNIVKLAAPAFTGYAEYHALAVMLGIVCYAVQIYADFSGYMDIATGAARMLGIRLAQNFDHPFFSLSVAEYWRRWHITLGAWFRDYLFYPMSMSKPAVFLAKLCRKHNWHRMGKLLPSYFSLLIVWATTGLWHGADWRFVAWGMANCAFIILSMQLEPLYERTLSALHIEKTRWPHQLFQILRTFLVMSLLRVLSRAPSLPDAMGIYRSLFTHWSGAYGGLSSYLAASGVDKEVMLIVAAASVLFLLVSLFQARRGSVGEYLEGKNILFQWTALFFMIFSVCYLSASGNDLVGGFIYAQF